MSKIKKILVATDLSPLSFLALRRGLEIAKKCKAKVTIIHILKKGLLAELQKNILPPVYKQLIQPREYAEQLIKEEIKLIQKNSKIDIKIIETKAKSAIKIVNYVKKNKIDLLLLGAHGQHAFRDWFVGTTGEYIVKKAPCPVLIIKKLQKSPYKKIMVAVDFSAASKAAAEFGRDLFPNSHFYILNVGDHAYNQLAKSEHLQVYGKGETLKNEIQSLLMNKAKQFILPLQTKKNTFSFNVKLGYPGLVILQEAKKTRANLVIMGTHGHSQYYYKWLGSVASRVLVEIDQDILLVPSKKTKRKKYFSQKMSILKKLQY